MMFSDFTLWWCVGLICTALVCRYFYARDQRIARIFMWVLLGIFLTPIGAVVVYMLLSAMNRRDAAPSNQTSGN